MGNKEGLRITDESAMAAWLGKHGVDLEKYKAAYKSFGVESRVRRASQMTQAYRLDGVATLVDAVNGAANATLDRQPLVVVTDVVSQADVGRIAHQRIDQRMMYAPATKWSVTAGGDGPIDDVARQAVTVAMSIEVSPPTPRPLPGPHGLPRDVWTVCAP